MRRALVLGAGGRMGARVCALLEAGLPAIDVIRASRGGAGRLGPGARSADVTKAESLRAVLGDVDLLVNAVGPYAYDPRPVVAACLEAGCHYLDLAEDPAFVGAAEDAAAGARCCVASGCSTVPGLIELLAHDFGPGVAKLEAWLSIGSANPASPGLLYGLLRPAGRLADGGERYLGRVETRHVSDGRRLRFGRHPAAFRGGQVAVEGGGRSVPAAFHTGFDRAWLVAGLVAAAPLLGRLGDDSLRAVSRFAAPVSRVLGPFGTGRGVLRVEGLGSDGELVELAEVVAEREGLDVPAAPVLWAASSLAGGTSRCGPARLPELVQLGDARRWLESAGHRLLRQRLGP